MKLEHYDYESLLRYVMDHGSRRDDRTGVGTLSIFGATVRYELSTSRSMGDKDSFRGYFPAVTTKKLAFKSVVGELLGFLRGYTNTNDFEKLGCNVWRANAEADYWLSNRYCKGDGDLGRIYSAQWNSWACIDGKALNQLQWVLEEIKRNPTSRRLIVTAWNPAELDQMALPPCHCFMQFYVNNNKLSLQMYQRSADLYLGVPFNIASYALLLYLVAMATELIPHEFIHTIGDAHIYLNHLDQVDLQLSRSQCAQPKLHIAKNYGSDFHKYEPGDFWLEDYIHHPAIKAPMAV